MDDDARIYIAGQDQCYDELGDDVDDVDDEEGLHTMLDVDEDARFLEVNNTFIN